QFPDNLDPVLTLTPYHGDLGLSSGKPQSVYQLDKSRLTPFQSTTTANPNVLLKLAVGTTKKLPDGMGSIRYDGVQRWVKLQVSHTPGKIVALGGVMFGILGLMGSLFIRPRRAWVRVSKGANGRTVVELAGLDRSAGGDLAGEIDGLEKVVTGTAPDAPSRHQRGTT
ncbi:MAG: cytochrome c biogenesis protein ResB, partial [Ornithinibacter sp.]